LIGRWLTGTFSGRALAGGSAIKVIALLLYQAAPGAAVIEAIDTLGDIAIVAAALTIGYRLFVDMKRVVLWRVRRKLTLSYIFIGFVPALLIIAFFLVAGLLLFSVFSAYSLSTRLDSVVERARFLAESAAQEVSRGTTDNDVGTALRLRHLSAVLRYPLASYSLVAAGKRCGTGTRRALALPQLEGAWEHAPPPTSLPDWVPCGGQASIVAFKRNGVTEMVARAVQWVPGHPQEAVIVDLPVDAEMLRDMGRQIGIAPSAITAVDDVDLLPADLAAEQLFVLGPESSAQVAAFQLSAISLPGLTSIGHVNWQTGVPGALMMQFRMYPAAVYERISATAFRRARVNFGQGLLFVMGVVGILFLIIQLIAFGMGLSLARSITGAVHELFEGTERVGRGDFTHKIPISSRDQLGELASSFNSMTNSIEYLLQEKAEKERLEQELRIARAIQMSLLPQGPLVMPGLALTPHCEPAREVGGDYYDYVPIDDDRIAILIADVSGKGTSAALYMAELKGIILSLSERHTSPRQLLINANRIISRHLDTRSFITITYAVVDLKARTLTYARAGHCPLIHAPGPHATSRTARILVPDGMVLGLQIDDGTMFSKALEEAIIPLGTGDLFLFYTDGISETMNGDGEMFGDARLAALLQRHADRPPTEIREHILREVQSFAGTAIQQDDMTMLLLGVGDRPLDAGRPDALVAAS
jgi:serine phosphatase RsbU (regulator of sigma subunit)